MNRAEKRRQQKLAKKAAKNARPGQSASSASGPAAPNFDGALNAAAQQLNAGQLADAERICQDILQADPNHPTALHLLGVIARQMGDNATAVALISKAIAINPGDAEAHNNLGVVLKELGRLDETIASYHKALAIKPDYIDAHYNLGNVFRELGKLDDAVGCYLKALALKPDYAEVHCNMGLAFQDMGNLDDAVTGFHKALAIKPDYADAQSNLGAVLRDQGKLDDAVTHYHQALAANPDFAKAHSNLGVALQELGMVDEAAASFQKALAIKPDFAEAHSNLLFAEHYRPGHTMQSLSDLHGEWEMRHAQAFRSLWPAHVNAPDPERRLRIGFVSPDLGRHPVGYFVVRLLENLPRTDMETLAYSDRRGDDLTERIEAATDVWRDVRGISDDHLAARITDDRIDILIDLAGHTSRNRLGVFARKPAPLQVTWAGYVATTGLAAMDYLLSDAHSTRADEDRFHSETIIRMPDSWLCYDPPAYAPAVGALPCRENTHVTFGSFNNAAKINADVVALWADILNTVPDSRLLLKSKGMDSPSNVERLTSLFVGRGLDPSRLRLEGGSPHKDLLACYNQVDIALDPLPYSGGLTTMEALWMGVPVITLPGATFASRHSLSHLSTVGLPELIAGNRDDYVNIAVGLAGDLPGLADLRAGLRERMSASPLCDGRKFADGFAANLRDIWRRWCAAQDAGFTAPP